MGTTVSGEPIAPAVEEPTPVLPSVEQEPEPVPAIEQDEGAESGAAESEDEGAELTPEARRQAALDALTELEEADPDFKKLQEERYAKAQEALTDEQLAEVAQKNVAARREWLEEQGAEFVQNYGPAAYYGKVKAALDAEAADIAAKAAKLKADPEAELPTLSADAQARAVYGYIDEAQKEAASFTWNAAKAALLDVVALHPGSRYISAEEHGYIQQALASPDAPKAIQLIGWVLGNAALRGAPDHAVTESVKVKEAEAKAAAATQKVLDSFRKDGTRPSKAKGGTPDTRRDAELLTDQDTPIEKIREIRARQRAAGH